MLPMGVREENLPPPARAIANTTWFDFKVHEGTVTVGCTACHYLQTVESSFACTSFGNFLTPLPKDCKPARFVRHHTCRLHQEAVRCLVASVAQGAAPAVAVVSHGAPPLVSHCAPLVSHCAPPLVSHCAPPGWQADLIQLRTRFSQAWKSCCDGLATASPGMKDIGGRRKVGKYQWCVYEALRESQCAFLLTAHVVWLARDERAGRLLVRYRAARLANGLLEVRHGVIGQTKGFGTGAENIKKATRAVIERFVTEGKLAPNVRGQWAGGWLGQ